MSCSSLCLVLLSAAPIFQERAAAWTQDVERLITEIERVHPDPFHSCSRAEFQSAAADLIAKIDEFDDDRVCVELMRLVGQLSREGREGHAAVWPMHFHLLPIHLYRFAEGWFVVAAENPDWIGARLEAVGKTPTDQVCELLGPLLARDNDSDLVGKLPFSLIVPEILHALAISPERDRASVRLKLRGGEVIEPTLVGQTLQEYSSWGIYPPTRLPPDPQVRWLQSATEPFAIQWLEEEGALYVPYTAVQSRDSTGRTLGEFAAELLDTYGAEVFDRVVLDLRNNQGGDNTTFGPLLDALASDEELNQRGRLFALVGRGTFSAAGNFITVLQQRTEAILVGEPTGGAPNQYGDAVTVSLPNHPSLLVRIATRYHSFGGPEDLRITHEPDLAVALRAEAYFAGEDPVLRAALDFSE